MPFRKHAAAGRDGDPVGAVRTEVWLRLLVATVAVEALLGSVTWLDEVRGLARGERSFATVTAAVGLGWLLVVLVTVFGVSRSIYRARGRLASSEEAIAGMVSTSRDWLWEADTDLRLISCSARVSDQLGYAPSELIGRAMPTLMTPDDQLKAERILADAIELKTGWNDVELHWRHADGHVVALQGSGVPIFDNHGEVTGFRGTRRAVTSAMATERALVAARGRLVALLATGDVDTALQPIVDITTGRLCGTEALARFRDGRGPDAWFADARETGHALDLDRLTFTTALKTIRALPDDAYLSINATPQLITHSAWQRSLLTGDLPLHRLVVEITEHVEIDRYDDVTAALLPLRERGMRLAVDDTGAGYASFSHVLQLRPDIIKIDRSLITGLADDPARRSLVTALVLLALDLGATLTAEGVENTTELDTLATLGVDAAQGYLLARPTTDPRRWRSWHRRHWTLPTDSPADRLALHPQTQH